MACPLILLLLSFAGHKIFSVMKSTLFIVSFIDCAYGVVSENSLSNPKSSRFSPVLSSGRFIALHGTFRPVICVEFILGKGVRSAPRFILWPADVQLVQHHLLKRLSLLLHITFDPLSKTCELCLGEGLISGIPVLLH